MLKHLTKRVRKTWKEANIVCRGDRHYGRREALDWCDDNGVGDIFGLAGNATRAAKVAEISAQLGLAHVLASETKWRCYVSFEHRVRVACSVTPSV